MEERALQFCERVCTMLDTPFEIENNSIRLSASIGMAVYPLHASSASELLQNADMAMYTRKRTGKNGSQVFDSSIMDRAREHAELERDIAQALSDDWFEAYFQPIQDLASGRTAGFEALLRLNHPEKGLLSPPPSSALRRKTARSTASATSSSISRSPISHGCRACRVWSRHMWR